MWVRVFLSFTAVGFSCYCYSFMEGWEGSSRTDRVLFCYFSFIWRKRLVFVVFL